MQEGSRKLKKTTILLYVLATIAIANRAQASTITVIVLPESTTPLAPVLNAVTNDLQWSAETALPVTMDELFANLDRPEAAIPPPRKPQVAQAIIPETSSALLMGTGVLLLLGGILRRKSAARR